MKFNLLAKGLLIDLSNPLVMGIINISPDSFYDGANSLTELNIEKKIVQYISEGASIIDIGAVSTRPGAIFPNEEEELIRLIPILKLVYKYNSQVFFSLDTFRSSIANMAVTEYGVSVINDISAGNFDDKMFETIAKLNVPYILMHLKGTPLTMQKNPKYDNMLKEISLFFSEKVTKLKLMGVKDIIIDPGFGFGKTIAQNYELLTNLEIFKIFDLPILIGLSRKSMIYKVLGNNPKDALNGTTVLNTIALLKGVNILRVHDVLEAKEAIKLVERLT